MEKLEDYLDFAKDIAKYAGYDESINGAVVSNGKVHIKLHMRK